MIQSFKNKGLKNFWENGSKKGIQPAHAAKLTDMLHVLDASVQANNMDMPGWVFHPMKHWGEDIYAVKVNGNWRLTFRFTGGQAYDVDYLDYH